MHIRIIRISNSQGIVVPKNLLQQCHLTDEVDMRSTPERLLIMPVARPAQQNWDAQMQAALAAGQALEDELLEGFADTDFEETEWQW